MKDRSMLTVPVSTNFYREFRVIAAQNNMTIAAYARQALERLVSEQQPKKDQGVKDAKPNSL